MKKAFVIGGVVLVGLLAIAGSIIGYWAYCGTALDRSSRAFVDEAIPAIATGWSPHELVKRESPSFFKATSDDQLVKLFVAFRKLGALKTYRGSKGEATINVTADSGKVVTATYVAHASFENGEAEFKLFLIQLDGRWKIQGFHVDSPVFARAKAI